MEGEKQFEFRALNTEFQKRTQKPTQTYYFQTLKKNLSSEWKAIKSAIPSKHMKSQFEITVKEKNNVWKALEKRKKRLYAALPTKKTLDSSPMTPATVKKAIYKN